MFSMLIEMLKVICNSHHCVIENLKFIFLFSLDLKRSRGEERRREDKDESKGGMKKENEPSKKDDSGETLPSSGSSDSLVFEANVCLKLLMCVLLNNIVYVHIGGATSVLEIKHCRL